MQQIKIFKGLESELTVLEDAANGWLRETGANVVGMSGNIAPQSAKPGSTSSGLGQSPFAASDVVLFLLYETPSA